MSESVCLWPSDCKTQCKGGWGWRNGVRAADSGRAEKARRLILAEKNPLQRLIDARRGEARPVASIALVRGGRVLLVREGRGVTAGQWNLPGGKLRAGESADHAAVRETREETGLRVELEALAGAYRYDTRRGRARLRLVFWGVVTGGSLRCDGCEILDARWFTLTRAMALPDTDLTCPRLLRRVFRDLADRQRIDLQRKMHVRVTAVAA